MNELIVASQMRDSGLQWKLRDVSRTEIANRLGFPPNVHIYATYPDLLRDEWAFTVDGVYCAIWAYGLETSGVFSSHGPKETLEGLFPGKVVESLYLPASLVQS